MVAAPRRSSRSICFSNCYTGGSRIWNFGMSVLPMSPERCLSDRVFEDSTDPLSPPRPEAL